LANRADLSAGQQSQLRLIWEDHSALDSLKESFNLSLNYPLVDKTDSTNAKLFSCVVEPSKRK